MAQFLAEPSDIAQGRFILRGPEAFHVSRVLRRKVGDEIEIFDGKGGRYGGIIRSIGEAEVAGDVTGLRKAEPAPPRARLHLYMGLLKASAFEWVLEKATELGCVSIAPIVTPRTVVRLREEATAAKQERWKKILLAAAKQSGRADIPVLEKPVHFRDAIVAAKDKGLILMGWERQGTETTHAGLRQVLAEARAQGPDLDVRLFIGPEGGFSDEEVELAQCEGAHLFHLGGTTLRAETAAIASAAIVVYELGA
ncbi:MAG TPA: RsmE family RNA methyltransferase [Elusimicrobiota bacterium]|nr:RsmE family RNA methyltransferase [Elusimicrobiota bacterium]